MLSSINITIYKYFPENCSLVVVVSYTKETLRWYFTQYMLSKYVIYFDNSLADFFQTVISQKLFEVSVKIWDVDLNNYAKMDFHKTSEFQYNQS